jgi:hypothetical protein
MNGIGKVVAVVAVVAVFWIGFVVAVVAVVVVDRVVVVARRVMARSSIVRAPYDTALLGSSKRSAAVCGCRLTAP